MAALITLSTGSIVNAQSNNYSDSPLDYPDEYISYLESFGSEYEEFIDQFSKLPNKYQIEILDVLKNGGELDVEISQVSQGYNLFNKNIDISPQSLTQRNVSYQADYSLHGITFVSVKLEGRFTRSGSTVKSVKYKNAYIVKNWIPLSGFSRSSLDAYVSGGRFYANAAFTAYVGAKIGDNIIGVTPRTFYIKLNCTGTGKVNGSAW